MTQFRFAFFVMSGDYRPEEVHSRFSTPAARHWSTGSRR